MARVESEIAAGLAWPYAAAVTRTIIAAEAKLSSFSCRYPVTKLAEAESNSAAGLALPYAAAVTHTIIAIEAVV